ncbi:MAG: lysophospholipid acyltransferase family protein [Verrucomicrobia bacterium]|nr:lysophospholipid acyltransferase family protein [Verrucomicrobiota bacterium]
MREYWTYKFVQALSCLLPRSLAYWVGLRVADILYRLDHAGREGVRRNLKQICVAGGIEATDDILYGLTRKVFQYFGKYLVDFFRFHHLTETDIGRFIYLQDKHHLREAADRGRGVIFFTGHFGNWELGGAVLAAMGYEPHTVAYPQATRKADALFREQRESRGMKLIPYDHATRGLIKCLREGKFVAVIGDRDFSDRTETVTFMGRPARIPPGAAWLSIKTGAPILPAFVIRQVDDTFLFRIHPPLFPEEYASQDELQDRLCRILEKEIKEHPYQWFIFSDFWSDNEGED